MIAIVYCTVKNGELSDAPGASLVSMGEDKYRELQRRQLQRQLERRDTVRFKAGELQRLARSQRLRIDWAFTAKCAAAGFAAGLLLFALLGAKLGPILFGP